jgi:hypothetical protein
MAAFEGRLIVRLPGDNNINNSFDGAPPIGLGIEVFPDFIGTASSRPLGAHRIKAGRLV